MAYGTYAGKREDEGRCPKGNGGDTSLVNQDEAKILERTTQLPSTRAEGGQDSDFH